MTFFDSIRREKKSQGSLVDELTNFYKEHRALVYTYFYKVTGSMDESEELTQETFYQAVKSIHRFKGQSSLKTWLLQIARNIYRNKVRSWVKNQTIYSSETVETQADASLNPQVISLQNHTRDEIQKVFLQMPEDYRDVLIYKEIYGLSHIEIAQILEKTPQTSKVLLYRAKKRFRELYKDEVVWIEEIL